MQNAAHTKMSHGRRIAIPASLCHEYGLEPGSPVVLEPTNSGIMVRPLEDVLREVQAYFAGIAPKDRLLSDELIRERREEAAREKRD